MPAAARRTRTGGTYDRSVSVPIDLHLDQAGEARLHRALRRCWHPVARASDLEEGPLPVTLLDEQLVVVRLGSEIACFPDLCVHRGTALSLGWVDGGDQPAAHGRGTVGEPFPRIL